MSNIKIIAALYKRITIFFRKPLEIYTDGGHKGKWGTWAFVVVSRDKIIHEASGHERRTNSHRMEFQAAIEALKYLSAGTKACIHTDSRVLLNSVAKKNKRPVVNSDQAEALDKLLSKHKITWKWVKAHSGFFYNERCDELCILARSFSAPGTNLDRSKK